MIYLVIWKAQVPYGEPHTLRCKSVSGSVSESERFNARFVDTDTDSDTDPDADKRQNPPTCAFQITSMIYYQQVR